MNVNSLNPYSLYYFKINSELNQTQLMKPLNNIDSNFSNIANK